MGCIALTIKVEMAHNKLEWGIYKLKGSQPGTSGKKYNHPCVSPAPSTTEDLERLEKLGQTLAAGLDFGIF